MGAPSPRVSGRPREARIPRSSGPVFSPHRVIPDCALSRASPESIPPGLASSTRRSTVVLSPRAQGLWIPGSRYRAPRNDEREGVTFRRRPNDFTTATTSTPVMRGLDPHIHRARKRAILRRVMDCRVKPGNDGDVSERSLDERNDYRVRRNGGGVCSGGAASSVPPGTVLRTFACRQSRRVWS
uniref:Uncharacterized protein n=1 Tax=Rhodopseudomonas palustris (strain ATCC BAA-98 / CGA009) TaxID=258594 RepID=Q6N378_RHOPA|nr:hypothetical protein RPA3816 [Rhodopseudomonas palustris CGA009]